MPSLLQGRIVYCRKPVPDPQGRNPKPNRPFVVLTHNDDIKGQSRVQGAGITDELHLSPKDHYYPLSTGPGSVHKCTPGSAVLCTFLVSLDVADLDIGEGYLKAKQVFDVIEKVKVLKPGEFQSRAPGEQPKPNAGSSS